MEHELKDGATIVMLWCKYILKARLGGDQDRESEYNFNTRKEAHAFLAGALQETPAITSKAACRAFLFGARERANWADAVLVDQDATPDQPSGIRQAVWSAEWVELLHSCEDLADVYATGIWSDERECWCLPRSKFVARATS